MDKTDIEKLVELRQFVLTYYKSLDGLHETLSVPMVKQTDVADVLSSVINSIDELVKDHVNFA